MTQADLLPQVFIVAGAAASGKSTYAKKLGATYGITILDLDDGLAQLITQNQDHISDVGMESFLAEIRDYRYADLQQRGIKKVNEGISIALVAPFTRHIREHQLWKDLCDPFRALGIEPKLHWVSIDSVVQSARLAQRGAQRDTEKIATKENLLNFVSSIDNSPPIHPYDHIDGGI